MLISSNSELRLHVPSNAVDDVSLLQGILDNSEKDFLRDKLGSPLYSKLCDYYADLDIEDFYDAVVDGSYTSSPYSELLLNAQRIITNDALARFAYQQIISVNGTGINVVGSNDYGSADDRLLDKGVSGYKKEAAIACNNLLVLLETWASSINASASSSNAQASSSASSSDASASSSTASASSSASSSNAQASASSAITEIITLWKQSKYYYYQSGLLIPSAEILQQYLDIYDNRDKFIRLLPDLRFIQKNYIRDAFGKDFVTKMLASNADADTLDDVRTLIALYLEERTTVLTIDKTRRQQAHNEAVAKKSAILATINAQASTTASASSSNAQASSSDASASSSYQNNQSDSKIFVSPLLY